ncbi:hypothetical protein AMTRI_Chr01g132300 [Amborella trichopoda]|uniref:Leucine-rich repeat-containing N-terminal plant-type domain-containing protein n=1 Tax=Amborella trichopoda TaxID=13333 RepID=W1NNV2_AMBTC|nr:receptor-like protein 51 [Amborella trichopoda]ERM97626.1 hypothetical protein AMTR_s00130p00017760 [Amborella trichopoda]|eukprot:XP_006830210.3 receptor-like protein 51 [Amborella trichopoda]
MEPNSASSLLFLFLISLSTPVLSDHISGNISGKPHLSAPSPALAPLPATHPLPKTPPSSSPSSSPLPKTPPPSSPSSSPLPKTPPSSSSPLPKTPSSSSSPLDPKQLIALESLDIPLSKDPCSQTSPQNLTLCNGEKPFRHLISLKLINCSDDFQISQTAIKALSTLQSLSFMNCPIDLIKLPPDLASNLRSFVCVNSMKKLTGVWLSKMGNLTELTVKDVTVNASGASIILAKMKEIKVVSISGTNLTGILPRKWHPNVTEIDLSGNRIKGPIPASMVHLGDLKLLNLSSNRLSGSIPISIGDMIMLRNLSLALNSLSGPIPESMAEIPSLVHLDLSNNQFNGSVPHFLTEMKSLKYLNLENNNFQGPIPFNSSFIKKLVVFKVGGNSNLCYNHSIVSSKLKLGIAQCDSSGLPITPPESASEAPSSSQNDDTSDDDSDVTDHTTHHHHGPNTIVLVVVIGLCSIIFLIIFCVLLSKWCS